MKKYLFIAAAALAAAALVSCNKDPEVKPADGDNTPAESTEFITKDATTVCINEVNGGDGYKGIELYNPTSKEVSLSGWKIVKNNEDILYWEAESSDKIAANGYFVIKANKSTTEIDALADAIASGGLSGKKAVKLDLVNGEIVVDTFDRGFTKNDNTEVALPDAGTNSFARAQDGKALWKIKSPTFKATNTGGQVIGDVTVDPE